MYLFWFQEKAVEELKEIFNESDRMPTYEDLSNMKYLEKVIKETLRIWPSVPYIIRDVTEDTLLPCTLSLFYVSVGFFQPQ